MKIEHCGEIDHPDDSVVNLKNVSHCVVEAYWQGNNVMGKIKILETPSGKIARSLIESRCSIRYLFTCSWFCT